LYFVPGVGVCCLYKNKEVVGVFVRFSCAASRSFQDTFPHWEGQTFKSFSQKVGNEIRLCLISFPIQLSDLRQIPLVPL
jgi:hypothetical protein